jgi:hypothetical protein
MSAPWIAVTAAAPPRGSGTQPPLQFFAQTIQVSKAWGSAPSEAMVTYVAKGSPVPAPVTSGAELTIECGGHLFWGICIQDTATDGTGGINRTLQFRDMREYLAWDYVFGAFNQHDSRIINGVRVKRYKHLFPADVLANFWTYTNSPLTAAEILNLLFSAPTILTSWATFYHADQFNSPVYDIDCQGGKTLGSVLQEISDKQGLVFGQIGGPFVLQWIRKGIGALPAFPANADDRRVGTALSGNATRVRVFGERNTYQLMNVPLLADWAGAWEQFIDTKIFEDDIYMRGFDPRTGLRFISTPNDPGQVVGRFRANAAAQTMTVREYVALRNAVLLPGETAGGGNAFIDSKKFNGRSRMDVPAALYVRNLLFRAFRPNLSGFFNRYGQFVPMSEATLVDRLLTRVTHNPATGVMTPVTNELADGNGYAIAKGYNVGKDDFQTLRPDQLEASWFTAGNAIWQYTPFQIDSGGDGSYFLLFDTPVYVSEDLLVKVGEYFVMNADATLQIPQASATLCVEAERYTYNLGVAERDLVENVGGLRTEAVIDGSSVTELPFADGLFADDKADEIASSLLNQQFYYFGGGYTVKGSNATPLTSIIDRVSVVTTPQGGLIETVDWTNERGTNAFQPERDLDRATREENLLPGESDLRQQARNFELRAAFFKQSPELVKSLIKEFGGMSGNNPTIDTHLTPGAIGKLPAGTPLKKKPTSAGPPGQANVDTTPVAPAFATADHNIFAGVTIRHNESVNKPMKLQTAGIALIRVRGPINANDPVGLGSGTEDYLVSGGTPSVGLAHQAIATEVIKLIPVRMGAGGAGESGLVKQFRVKSVQNDHLVCREFDGTTEGLVDVLVTKPFDLRRTGWHGQAVVYVLEPFPASPGTLTITYSFVSPVYRIATATNGVVEHQIIIPRYLPNRSIVFACKSENGTGVSGVEWIDLNDEGRAWSEAAG